MEIQYSIASSLTVVINVDNYEYINSAGDNTATDTRTASKLIIKAAF